MEFASRSPTVLAAAMLFHDTCAFSAPSAIGLAPGPISLGGLLDLVVHAVLAEE